MALHKLSFENHPFSSLSTSTATWSSPAKTLVFNIWSPRWGTSTIWQSFMRDSHIDPNPQWLTKHPTDGWLRIDGCCTHPPWTAPLPPTLSLNPSGKASSMVAAPVGGFRATRNGRPVSYNPRTSSWNWSFSRMYWLPNAQNIIEPGLNPPSHSAHLSSSGVGEGSGSTGPVRKTGFPYWVPM